MSFVTFENVDNWGVITLQKPKTLNALDLNMVLAIRQFLRQAERNSDIQGILFQSSVSDIFCAGGDIKAVYQWYTTGDQAALFRYIEEEYGLNQQIKNFSKPTVAIMDGLTLGGGVGLSRYTDYRIVSDTALVGMPEIKIAFFPDVGAGYFLNLLASPLARFLALTGVVLKGNDLVSLGYATHITASSHILRLRDEILEIKPNEIDKILPSSYITDSKLDYLLPIINCFRQASLLECLDALKICKHPEAEDFYTELRKFSPLALHIVWRYMDITCGLKYEDVLEIDLNLAKQMFKNSDVPEGIRTRLIDKGDQPKWRYPQIEDVSKDDIDPYFQTLQAL
ncbi:MAG: enoyl-CoA hydratase/isomerase family protein [Candidatus Paracaedibacteraceae bacterium]|nr:enoyl-CoA hydratase/isomerase family protein [Candidatus Paracaedibacteraceae bacterium]